MQTRAPVESVRIDPDGTLPLANSANDGMHKAYLFAQARAGLHQVVIVQGDAFLREQEDDQILDTVTSALFRHGRWQGIVDRVDLGALRGCSNRDACRIAIRAARALGRLGRTAEASALLDAVAAAAQREWLGATMRRAREEIAPASADPQDPPNLWE